MGCQSPEQCQSCPFSAVFRHIHPLRSGVFFKITLRSFRHDPLVLSRCQGRNLSNQIYRYRVPCNEVVQFFLKALPNPNEQVIFTCIDTLENREAGRRSLQWCLGHIADGVTNQREGGIVQKINTAFDGQTGRFEHSSNARGADGADCKLWRIRSRAFA